MDQTPLSAIPASSVPGLQHIVMHRAEQVDLNRDELIKIKTALWHHVNGLMLGVVNIVGSNSHEYLSSLFKKSDGTIDTNAVRDKKTVFAIFKGKDAQGRVQDALDHIHSFVGDMVRLLGSFDGICQDITRSLTDHSKILEFIRPPNPRSGGVTLNDEAVVDGNLSKTVSDNLDKIPSSAGLSLDASRIRSPNPDDISATLEEENQNTNVTNAVDNNFSGKGTQYDDNDKSGKKNKRKGGSGKTGHTELMEYLENVYWRQGYVLDSSAMTDRVQGFLGRKYSQLNVAEVGPLVWKYVKALKQDKVVETKPLQTKLIELVDELLASSGYAGYSGKRHKVDKFVKNIISNTNYGYFFRQHGS